MKPSKQLINYFRLSTINMCSVSPDITMSGRQEIAANAIVLSWSNKSVITLNKVKILGVQVF